MTLSHFGFEHFPVGSGDAVLLVYGEAVYRAVCRSGRFYTYSKVGLACGGDHGSDGDDPAALRALFRKLRSRAVVIWPDVVADGYARALGHAALLAEAGVAAVGVVEASDDEAPDGPRAWADAALEAALARALPAQGTRSERAVAPHRGPLDAGAMLQRLRAVFARHLAEPSTTLDVLALWALHAWCVRARAASAFDVSPRLVLFGHDARADHARALRLLAWLTPRPLIVARTIAAHLVQAIATDEPTLLLDDVAGGLFYRRDMRALIAAGASRDGVVLGPASQGKRGNPSGRWASFAPAAIATTAVLPDDVHVRAIVVPMAPAPAGSAGVALGEIGDDVLALRAEMQAFAASMDVAASDVQTLMPRGFGRAARENWAPLLAIASAIGARVAARAVAAAEALSVAEPPPASNLALLADIRALAPLGTQPGIPSARLIDVLTADAERPWASIRRGGKLDARGLAERLSAFGLKPVTIRFEGDVFVRGYRAEDLNDAFARYLGLASATCGGAEAAA